MSRGIADVVALRVAGRDEYCLVRGPRGRTPILLLPALFGEMNRTRRLLADVMAALDAAGRHVAMPDLPGTGESPTDLADVRFADWRETAVAAAEHLVRATGRRPFVASLRGGALLDDAVGGADRWRLAPIDGATVLRDLARAQQVMGDGGDGARFAGRPLAEDLAAPLAAAALSGTAQVARLATDAKPADSRFDAAPLWRRAEPGRDLALAAAIAAELDRLAA